MKNFAFSAVEADWFHKFKGKYECEKLGKSLISVEYHR